MDTLQSGLQMIRELFHLDICSLSSDGRKEKIQAFARKNCLHPVQYTLTATGLETVLAAAGTGTVTFATDPFYMEITVVTICHTLLLLGPFASSPLSERDAADILKRQEIRELSVHQFLLYRESYPTLTQERMEDIIRSLIRVYDPESDERKVRKIQPVSPEAEEPDLREYSRVHYIQRLQQRYENEQHFMEDIRRGRTRSALLNLRNMQKDVSYLKRIGTALENERIGAAITRTSARIAAWEAGLPPVLIDQISSENTRKTMNARTVPQILQAKEEMIAGFCRAVAANTKQAHSALGQSALYYLEHEYYRKIHLDEMASDLDTSRTKLIQVFRKEYGVTPNEYLNRFRMQKAAFLLGSSDKSIQEISQIVGIGDANYFVKVFRRQYGKTPGEYRRQSKV